MVHIVPQCNDQGNEEAHAGDFPFIIKNYGPVVAQYGAYVHKENGPGHRAYEGEDDEFRQGKLGDTGGLPAADGR